MIGSLDHHLSSWNNRKKEKKSKKERKRKKGRERERERGMQKNDKSNRKGKVPDRSEVVMGECSVGFDLHDTR